jgi:hypothetical protein
MKEVLWKIVYSFTLLLAYLYLEKSTYSISSRSIEGHRPRGWRPHLTAPPSQIPGGLKRWVGGGGEVWSRLVAWFFNQACDVTWPSQPIIRSPLWKPSNHSGPFLCRWLLNRHTIPPKQWLRGSSDLSDYPFFPPDFKWWTREATPVILGTELIKILYACWMIVLKFKKIIQYFFLQKSNKY